MPALAIALPFLRRWWPVLVAVLALAGLWWWHTSAVRAAYASGAAAQKTVDTAAFAKAERAATATQDAIIASLKPKQAAISKGTDDALAARTDDIARGFDALRLQWTTHRADQGGAGQGGATAAATATGGADGTYCPAQGWVSFDTAATAAQAADEAIAKDDAWRAWWAAQSAAWPQ